MEINGKVFAILAKYSYLGNFKARLIKAGSLLNL